MKTEKREEANLAALASRVSDDALRTVLATIASLAHNLPRSATADQIDTIARAALASPAQEPVAITVEGAFPNVDEWGAAEWFARLVDAIANQDRCVVAGDELGFETWKNIAASSAMCLAREYASVILPALAAPPAPAPAQVAVKADIAEFMRRLGPQWFLEQGWFPKSQQEGAAHLAAVLHDQAERQAVREAFAPAQVGADLVERYQRQIDRGDATIFVDPEHMRLFIALAEGQATEGMVLVPREPTDAMIDAAYPWVGSSRFSFGEMYRALLAAAPSPAVQS